MDVKYEALECLDVFRYDQLCTKHVYTVMCV